MVSEPGVVQYLCLQDMTDGTASAAHTGEIVAGLRRRGWRVDLYAVQLDGGETQLLRRLRAMLLAQVRLVVSDPADVLYVRAHPAALPAVVWCRFRGRPVVTEVNGPVEDAVEAWPALRKVAVLLRWSAVLQLRLSAHVIAVTDGLARHVTARTRGRVPTTVIPNAADVERFSPAAAGPAGPALFFGSFAPWQGLRTLLDAAATDAWPPDLLLVLAGDGFEQPLVEEAAARMPDRVLSRGRVPSAEIPSLVSGSSMVLIPKDYEHADLGLSPIKLYESMAAGVPVVVSDVPGLADVVAMEDCGVVVPARDASALAEAVAVLHRDQVRLRQLGANGRRAAVERHAWSHRAVQTAQVLVEATAAWADPVEPPRG